MMGLLSPPAVMRLLSLESTPVRLPVAVGHKLERTSRVTWWEAKAVSRAMEICGLFCNASASACFNERDIGIPALAWESEDGCPIAAMGAGCAAGAEGKFCTVCG